MNSDTPVSDLGLSVQEINILRRNGINTLDQLLATKVDQLANMQNMTPFDLYQILDIKNQSIIGGNRR
jgi:DNA-directed RNA polymerase alpha subunit